MVPNTTVETHPNTLSATAVIGDSIVRAEESLRKQRAAEVLCAESNKDLCRRFIQKIFNEGEMSQIQDFMSPDAVNHELVDAFGDSEPPQGHNIGWMTDLVDLYRHAFPDLRLEIQDQIAEGDRVVTCVSMQGTQKNTLMAIPASGRKVEIAGIRVDRITAGRIVESWAHFDALGMLRQLDALPALNRGPQKAAPISHNAVPPVGWNPAPTLPQSALVS